MKIVLLILGAVFGLASLWDGATTFYGTLSMFDTVQNKLPAVIMSGVVTLVISTLMLASSFMFSGGSISSGGVNPITLILVVGAFSYDLYTSFIGKRNLIMGVQSMSDMDNPEQVILLFAACFFTTMATVLTSFIVSALMSEGA